MKAKTSNSPSAGKGLRRKAKPKAAKRPSRDVRKQTAAAKPKGAAAKPETRRIRKNECDPA